jgi:DNA replication protein DnaC
MCRVCSDATRALEDDQRRQDVLRRARIPERLWWAGFDRVVRQGRDQDWASFRARVDAAPGHVGITTWNVKAATTIRDWQTTDPMGLYVWGPIGSGKTTLIAARANALAQGGADLCWVQEAELLTGKPLHRMALFDRCCAVRVLVLDDLGVTSSIKGWQRDMMQDLFARRYAQALPMLISANLPIDAPGPRDHSVARRYGERVASRLIQMVGGNRAGLPGYLEVRGYDWRTDTPHATPRHFPAPPKRRRGLNVPDMKKRQANDDS